MGKGASNVRVILEVPLPTLPFDAGAAELLGLDDDAFRRIERDLDAAQSAVRGLAGEVRRAGNERRVALENATVTAPGTTGTLAQILGREIELPSTLPLAAVVLFTPTGRVARLDTAEMGQVGVGRYHWGRRSKLEDERLGTMLGHWNDRWGFVIEDRLVGHVARQEDIRIATFAPSDRGRRSPLRQVWSITRVHCSLEQLARATALEVRRPAPK